MYLAQTAEALYFIFICMKRECLFCPPSFLELSWIYLSASRQLGKEAYTGNISL